MSRLVIAHVANADVRARILSAVRTRATVSFVSDCESLLARCREARPAAVFVTLRSVCGTSSIPTVRRLKERHAALPVIAYAGLSQQTSRDITEAVRAGVDRIVLHGYDDEGAVLREAIAHGEDHALASRVAGALRSQLGVANADVLRYCVEHARAQVNVQGLADAFGVHRRTLVSRLEPVGLSPLALIGWSRLIAASDRLSDPRAKVDHVAMELDFSSGSSLRNMLKRYTGVTPAELRVRGGVEFVIAGLQRSISPPGEVRGTTA